jgi:hypothetical protein
MELLMQYALHCVVILALAAGAATAQEKNTYRWKDEKGRTHYSDVAAPRSEKLDIKPNGKVNALTPAQRAAENMGRECQRRRDQLASYLQAGDITETDALGNSRSYTEQEKQQLIERVKEQVKEYCGEDPANPPS